MRTLLAALLLLLQGGEARRDPWAGYGVGSWVILLRKFTGGPGEGELKNKQTLASLEEGVPVCTLHVERDGKFVIAKNRSKHDPGLLPEKDLQASAPRTEELTIGGRKLSCSVTAYERDEKGVTTRLTLWRCAELKVPYRELLKDGPDFALLPDVVKIEYSMTRRTFTEKHRLQVVALDEKLKVGDKEVACILEEGSGEEDRDGDVRGIQVRRWLSAAVPGHVVRMELTLKSDAPQEVVTQVLDFEVRN